MRPAVTTSVLRARHPLGNDRAAGHGCAGHLQPQRPVGHGAGHLDRTASGHVRDEEVRRAFHGGGEPLLRHRGRPHVVRSQAADELESGAETRRGQQSWVHPPRESAQVVEGSGDLLQAARQAVVLRRGVVGPTDVEAEREQLLLRAVVEVAFEAPPGLVGRPTTRALEAWSRRTWASSRAVRRARSMASRSSGVSEAASVSARPESGVWWTRAT